MYINLSSVILSLKTLKNTKFLLVPNKQCPNFSTNNFNVFKVYTWENLDVCRAVILVTFQVLKESVYPAIPVVLLVQVYGFKTDYYSPD